MRALEVTGEVRKTLRLDGIAWPSFNCQIRDGAQSVMIQYKSFFSLDNGTSHLTPKSVFLGGE